MQNLSAEQIRAFTGALSKAGIAIGGTASKVKTAAPNGAGVDFCINGIAYHLADTDDFWTLSGTTIPVSSSCLVLLCVNSAGTMSIVQGTAVLTADITSGAKTLKVPQHAATVCPIGLLRIDTNASVPFVMGTTELSAAGITDTYYDIAMGLPFDFTT